MPKIKYATGGQSIHPKIELTFWDEQQNKYFLLCKDMKNYSENSSSESLTGYSFEPYGRGSMSNVGVVPQI